MEQIKYRVVLDTNQIVGAGSRWLDFGKPAPDPNASRQILINVAEQHTGLYCDKIVGEYLEKLIHYRHPPMRALRLMTYIMGAFEVVQVTSTAAPHPPSDPDDEVFLLCAIDGLADILVSDDRSLLDLKEHYHKPAISRSAETVKTLGAE